MSGNNYVMKEPVIVEAEFAVLLRLELGDLYQWTDFLRDARRGRHSDYALPYAFKCSGRYYYHLNDAHSFIAQVRNVFPEADKGLAIVVDEAADVTNGRKVQKVGKHSALSEKAKARLLH